MKGKKRLALCLALMMLCCSACAGGSSGNTAAGDTASSAGGAVEYGNSGGTGMDMELYEPAAPGESQSVSAAEEDESYGSVYQNSSTKLIRRAERAWEGLRRSARPSDATRLAETEQALDGLRKMKEEWQSWQP